MKNEITKLLENDEKLLFYGKAHVSKTDKQYGRIILISVILMLFWKVILIGIKNGNIDVIGSIAMVFILILLTLGILYGLIYNMFLKYKNKYNEYAVTSKRVVLYTIKDGFRFENISDIEHIGIGREKNNYCDITFNFKADTLLNLIKNTMCFEGIENPREVVNQISEINSNIHIYDDIPTKNGEKIR